MKNLFIAIFIFAAFPEFARAQGLSDIVQAWQGGPSARTVEVMKDGVRCTYSQLARLSNLTGYVQVGFSSSCDAASKMFEFPVSQVRVSQQGPLCVFQCISGAPCLKALPPQQGTAPSANLYQALAGTCETLAATARRVASQTNVQSPGTSAPRANPASSSTATPASNSSNSLFYIFLIALIGAGVLFVSLKASPTSAQNRTSKLQTSKLSTQNGGFEMSSLIKLIANAPTYVVLYLLFMVPTYLLPYIGSNSAALNAAGKSAGAGFSPAFWLHLISLLILCILAWARGSYVAKTWIVVFPIIALVFDLVAGLNLVPFVPTVMHLCAIIVGVSSQKVVA